MANDKETVCAQSLRALCAAIFTKRGMRPDHSERVAEVLVWADLSGHGSHGVSRVSRYLDFAQKDALRLDAQPEIDLACGALTRIEGNRCAGALAMELAVTQGIERAREHGITMALVANTTHIGAAGFYAEEIARAGMIALVGSSSAPLMAYHGTAAKSVSTAPLAIGIPGGSVPDLVLDMASSVVALGKIRQAQLAGEQIPLGWALDREGEPTRDPAKADIQLPMAGPKGAGLSLMLECLSGVLAGAPILAGTLIGTMPRRHRQNAFLIAIDVARFQPLDAFTAQIEALAAAIKAQPRSSGVEEILMPGERSARARERSLKDGITLRSKLLDELRALAR